MSVSKLLLGLLLRTITALGATMLLMVAVLVWEGEPAPPQSLLEFSVLILVSAGSLAIARRLFELAFA